VAIAAQNRFLSIEERHAAACLYAALKAAKAAYASGERSAEVLRARMTDVIAAEPMARPDYISVADAESLDELQRISRPAIALLAVWIGKTRLADALPIGSEPVATA
jgi:pantoate--beta-alanine ligase